MAEQKTTKLFGTDGIRGRANEYPMTGELVMQVGRATAYLFRNRKEKKPVGLGSPLSNTRRAKILIGKDTRLSCYMIEMALASGICSLGVDVLLIGPMPTPGIAFLAQSMRCDAGIQISASHNAFDDNGVKIFSADGYKLPDSTEAEIERLVFSKEELEKFRPTADHVGKAYRIEDALGRYIVHVKDAFDEDLDLQGVRLILDCANGASYKAAPLVFEELGAEVVRKGVNPTGLNINDKCGSLYPENVARAVVEYRADIGISLDGDGDRVILSDETGEIVDGDQIMAICALEMKRLGTLKKNTVVVTPMSNIGFDLSLKAAGIDVVRAGVGDRNVVEAMKNGGYNFGGEQSGHIILMEHATTGDGIVAALKVLEVMRRTGKRLSELKRCVKLFPQVRADVRVSRKEPLKDLKEVNTEIAAAEKALQGKGRVFVRASGTEPIVRVLLEGEDHAQIHQLSRKIAASITRALG
ncbi:MAG: phosphoglucosamine mutase [Deltaproteobacteria bacterium]|nr:phosphoglucosamine mutase [Deltaproteobacteria bacterium]